MRDTPSMVIHYGHHESTTGSHFAEAAIRLGVGNVYSASQGIHVFVDELDSDTYLWIESGVTSLPLDSYKTSALTAGYIIDVHLHTALSLCQAKLFDVVFVAQRDHLPVFQEVHPQAYWLPLAAPIGLVGLPRGDDYDASFVGNLLPWTPRERIMDAVARRVRTNDYRRRHSVAEMGRTYASSAIVVNPAVAGDLNMRFFEALACGAVVLMPDVGNGQDVIAVRDRDFFLCDFRDPEVVADSVTQLLADGVSGLEARSLIAAAHTYDHRIRTIKEVLSSADVAAPIRDLTRRERADLFSELAVAYYDSRLALTAVKQVARPRDLSKSTAISFAQVGPWKSVKSAVRRRLPAVARTLRRRRPPRRPHFRS